jgi:hypothetical protein
MKQNYSIEVAENGYIVTFQTGNTKIESYVFPTFAGLSAFIVERLRWLEKSVSSAP